MPHEKIHDRHNRSTLPGEEIQPPQPFLEIGWSSGPTPLHDDEQPDGWVQVSSNREGTDAMIANPDESAVYLATRKMVEAVELPNLSDDDVSRLAGELSRHMRYAFGQPVVQFAIQLDREGCNRAVRTLRRARDKAYGADA